MSRVRVMLLALVLFGSAGLLVELLLLEHFDDEYQLVPIVLLVGGLAAGAALALRPSRATVRSFQATMLAFLAAAAIGLWLHVTGNAEFEREIDGSAAGIALLWISLRGATPALAPGALAQLGILGLILTYRHPALRRKLPSGDARLHAAAG